MLPCLMFIVLSLFSEDFLGLDIFIPDVA